MTAAKTPTRGIFATVVSHTAIFHVTHIGNLPAILADGGIRSNNALAGMGSTYRDVASASVQSKRASVAVPCGPGGTLHDYAPFYFAPRSPMLFRINCREDPRHSDGQDPMIYLVSTAEAVAANGLGFAIADGHGIMKLTQFYDDLAKLSAIDWAAMKARYWKDTRDNPDRERRRQAEFLVHDFFPWELFVELGVIDSSKKAAVEAILGSGARARPVRIRPDWYY